MNFVLYSILQMILIQYFARFQENMQFRALPEARTQIIEGARYRIPDILLCPKPLPHGKVVNIRPLAIIEILSPDDRMGQTFERFRDYARIGTGNIVQMDPEKCVAQTGSASYLSIQEMMRKAFHILMKKQRNMV